MTTFTLNGQSVTVNGEYPHLLAAFRNGLGVTSPKDGCAPSGQCGACTVLVDGKARVACQTELAKLEGAEVLTLEGLHEDERNFYADTFAAHGALQCGFCTPGILMRTKALVNKKGENLQREEAARLLGGNLCRCTGYLSILDSIEDIAQGVVPKVEPAGGIGSCGIRYEAQELALGDRGFIDDMTITGMLEGVLRLADHARADVLKIDTSRAEASPGVVKVLTAADVPGELRVGIIHQDWPVFIPEGGRTSYLGDVLAMVIAETRAQATAATDLIEIEYQPLKPITDMEQAASDPEDAVWDLDGNILSTSVYRRGDADQALADSPFTVHEVFHTQRVEQAFLEPESTLVAPLPEGKFKMWSGGQGIWDDRNQVAKVLGIDPSRIEAVLVTNGGAFGGKEDLSNQAQTALGAFLTNRPVKCTLTREQSLLMHAKRHPIRLEYWAGCDEQGRLTAVKARMLGDSGPYASVGMKVLERAAGHAGGAYRIPHMDVESVAVRTNNPVCGAFRGFGANQAQFAMEGVLDRLAEQVGLDSWEIRHRNVVEPGDEWGPGQILDSGSRGARVCLAELRDRYYQAKEEGKAVGLALGVKNSGLGNGAKEVSKAVVRFEDDGTVEVRHCWTEMGQGINTVAQQVAVEELGIAPEQVKVFVDTSRELGAGQTTGSRGTLMGAGSVAAACRNAIEEGREKGVDYTGEYTVDWTDAIESGERHPIVHSTLGFAAQMVIVDQDTGEIDKVVAVHDVGRAINPTMLRGQVEGAVHMGLGYALTEEFPADELGRPTNMTIRSLGILRAKDMPEVESVIVEVPQPDAPYGVKGVGEIGLVPTAPAVAKALQDRDGVWRNRLPMKD